MNRVFLAAEHSVAPTASWEAGAGELAIDVAAPLLERTPVDAMFVAAPAGMPDAGPVGPMLADRLGMPASVPVYALEAGGASGAAALHAATAHVAAGLAKTVLVMGVAKVCDLDAQDRLRVLDRRIDPEGEAAMGLTYVAMAGLLADLAVRSRGLPADGFAHVVIRNAQRAADVGEAVRRHVPLIEEARRDLDLAPPLRRGDLAPLLDGATALLVTDSDGIDRLGGAAALEIVGLGAGCDLTVVADRPEPLAVDAVDAAVANALVRAGTSLDAMAQIELDNACSLLEVLALARLGIDDGALDRVNVSGGVLGRGHGFGVSGLDQARAMLRHLPTQAPVAEGRRGVTVSIDGLASAAYATVFSEVT